MARLHVGTAYITGRDKMVRHVSTRETRAMCRGKGSGGGMQVMLVEVRRHTRTEERASIGCEVVFTPQRGVSAAHHTCMPFGCLRGVERANIRYACAGWGVTALRERMATHLPSGDDWRVAS